MKALFILFLICKNPDCNKVAKYQGYCFKHSGSQCTYVKKDGGTCNIKLKGKSRCSFHGGDRF